MKFLLIFTQFGQLLIDSIFKGGEGGVGGVGDGGGTGPGGNEFINLKL